MSRQRRKEAVEDLEYKSSSPIATVRQRQAELPETRDNFGVVKKLIKKLVVWLSSLYCLVLLVVYFSSTVRHQLIYLNYLCNPFINYKDPKAFGLPDTVNFYVNGNSGRLGVWYTPAEGSTMINDGKPVVLYMHGNAYSRAVKHRVGLYKVLSGLGYHVIAHDYRGFGDSDGTPTEQGVIDDSLSVFQWIVSNTNNAPVYLWGHSLGSGVAVAVSKILTEKEISIMGVVLEAPFNNGKDAAFNHFLAIPYRILPFFQDTLQEINEIFKSDERISSVKYDILILHDHADRIVQFKLGKKLYEAALKHKKEKQLIKFQEFTGFSHNSIFSSEDLPAILRNFMKLDET